MIWIFLSLFACGEEKKTEKVPANNIVVERIVGTTAPKDDSTEQKKPIPHSNTKDTEQKTATQNSGAVHTQIGQKNVDITYEHMEDIKGTENGKKIKGLNLKIGNMEITVDEVEIEDLKIEKK